MTPAKRARRRAAKNLDELYARQNGLCHYCQSYCAMLRNIPAQDLIEIMGGFVKWRIDQDIFRARVAIIDHVDPLRDGGANVIGNMVMACQRCNGQKDKTPPEPIRKMCRNCGGEKENEKKRHCNRCVFDMSAAFLKNNGFIVRQTDDGYFRFTDTVTGIEHKLIKMAMKAINERLEDMS